MRVAALKDQVAAGITKPTPDGLAPAEALAAVGERVKELAAAQETVLIDRLLPALDDEGIRICRWADLDDDDRKYLIGVYDQRIFPVLTPLAVDPAHPFPYVSGLALSLAVMVRDPETGEERFARVKVPTVFPRLVPLPDGKRFVPVEEVIEAQLPTLFSGMEIRKRDVVPRHPQRRPHARGGGGRRPAGRGRDGAAPAALRRGGTPRGRGDDHPEAARTCW